MEQFNTIRLKQSRTIVRFPSAVLVRIFLKKAQESPPVEVDDHGLLEAAGGLWALAGELQPRQGERIEHHCITAAGHQDLKDDRFMRIPTI